MRPYIKKLFLIFFPLLLRRYYYVALAGQELDMLTSSAANSVLTASASQVLEVKTCTTTSSYKVYFRCVCVCAHMFLSWKLEVLDPTGIGLTGDFESSDMGAGN